MIRSICRAALLVLAASVVVAADPPAASAPAAPEAIFFNARIHTLDPQQPAATAIAVRDGRIVGVGPDAEMLALRGPETRTEDLRSAVVVPGLIDAHGHMAGLGSFGLGRLDLSRVSSYREMVALVAAEAGRVPADQWVVGGRWDHESWEGRQLPTHQPLSEAMPAHPVWLKRVDGHAGLANAAAMRRAGITRETQAPPGGAILRDAAGEPTGVLIDTAMALVERHVAAAPDTAALLLKAQEMCLSVGLTGVHDAGVSPADIDAYEQLIARGDLRIRVYALVSFPVAVPYFAARSPRVDPWLTVRACKLYADGALGSRGAWLHGPYADRPTDETGREYTGLAIMPQSQIRQVALDGLRRGYQVCTHAIGDRANSEVLDAYEAAIKEVSGDGPPPEPRFRIEHAQILALDDIARFASLGVIASMQPTHCTSDMRWAEARIGTQRVRGAYAWASLLRAGAKIAAGSDFPVESHNPMLGFYAAVTRQNEQGQPEGGWQPQERMTREQALRAFTIDAAYAAFEESEKGTLEAGKLADFVVLDRDILTCPEREILATRVLQTVVGGRTVFRR